MLCACVLVPTVFSSCKEAPPEPSGPSTFLAVEDVSCTEAWLKVSLATLAQPRTIAIQRDGRTILTAELNSTDSVFVDDSLSPKHTYAYQAQKIQGSVVLETTPTVQAATMDTTSHNFTWQIDTLGDGASSALYNVAIINDTLVYAVGEIYLRDSTGQIDPQAYNLVIWNGKGWQIKRILFPLCDQNGNYTYSGPFTARGIFALSSDEIWISCDVSLLHMHGGILQPVCMPLGYGQRNLGKMWGRNGTLFLTGSNGFIAYFNSYSWQQLSSGTTLPILDIWGGLDSQNSQEFALCVASDTRLLTGRALLKVQGSAVSSLPIAGLGQILGGIWFIPNRRYYIVGDGLYVSRSCDGTTPWMNLGPTLTPYALTKVRGTALNDVIFVGDFGVVFHFNGLSFRNYQSQTYLANGFYTGVDVKGKFVVAVGLDGARAVALRGYRQ